MIIFLACMILGFEETLASTDCQFKGDMCAIRPECIEEKYRSHAMSDCYEVLDTAPLYHPNSSLSYLIHVDFAVVPDGEQPDDWIYTIYQRNGHGTKTKLTPLEEKCCNMKNATTDSCTLAPEKEYVAIFPTNEGFCEFRIIRDDNPLELCEEGKDIDGACLYFDDGAFFVKYEYYLTADRPEIKETNEIPMDKCYFPAPNHLFNGTYEIGKDGITTEGIEFSATHKKPYGYLVEQKIKKNCRFYQKVLTSNHSDFAYANWAKNTGSFVCYGYKFITHDAKYFRKPYCMKMGFRYDALTIALSVCCAVVLVLIVATVVIRTKLKRKMKKAESYLANSSMIGLQVGTDEKTKSVNDLVTDEEACPIPVIQGVENLAIHDEVKTQQNDTSFISKEDNDMQTEPRNEAIKEKELCPEPINNGYLPKNDNSMFEHTDDNLDVPMVEQTEDNPYFSKGFGNQIGDPIIEKTAMIDKSPILDSYTSKKFLSGSSEESHNELFNYSDNKGFESPSSELIAKYDEDLPGYIAKQNLIRSVE